MDPVLRAALSSWDLRPDLIIILTLVGGLYLRGWWGLRRRTVGRSQHSGWHLGAAWRPAVYLGTLLLLAIALMSPIDVLGSQLFTMHMIQHVILVMIVPPFLLLANPFPVILWGLPRQPRLQAASLFNRRSKLRHFLQKTTSPGLVWFYFVTAYWGWHDPGAYNAALSSPLLHDLEHISFLGTALLFWWHVIDAGPHLHRRFSPLVRIAYIISAIPPNMLAGIAIAFATSPIYTHYEVMPRLWGMSVMQDQQLAGVIMWVPGSMMYIIAVLILAGRWLQGEEVKPPLPEKEWASEEALAAPGWEK